MSPSYARLRPATALFIACLLGSVCSVKKEKERAGPGAKEHFQTGVGRAKHIESPTNVNARVFCNNTVEVTWEYDPLELLNIDGFFTVLCLEDGSNCFNKSILSDETGIVYDHAVYSTIYQESVFAYKGGKYSTPAQATFTTYPKIPDLEDLTITAISPRELKAQWGRKWKDNIEFSLCTVEEPCQNETVPGDELEHIFNDQKPGTMYTVSAQAEATLKGRTCKGNVHKDNAATLPLPAPTNLAVTLSCDGNVEATWQYDAHAGIEGFITQLCHKDGSACQNKTLLASSRNTNYTVTEPDTSFYISVRAFVDEGYTSRADEVSFTSFPKLPDLDDLTVRGISPTEVQATWSDAWNGDIEFVICRESAQCENQTVRGDLHSYTFSDLEPDTEYSVSAQAEISWLHKTCKGHKQERGTSTLRLEPPKNLTVDVSCANEASVKWKYDDEKHVNGFVIRLCYGVDEEHCHNETVSNTVRSHSFALPEANALYNVTLWAYYSTNKSNKSFSLPAEANFTSYPDLPELRSVTVKGVSTTQLLATWQDEWAADIYFTICSSPTECRKDTAQGIQHNHTFSGLQENTTYTVATKTGATLNNKTCYGHEQNRTAATFVTRPGKIQNLKEKIVNGTLLEVAWDAPKSEENVSGYTIECSDDHTHYNESRDIHGGKKFNDVSFILHEVSATFNCSVRAFNLDTNGHRVYGPPESFDVTTDGIDVPKDVTLVKSTATSLTYMWSADPNATKCEVELHKEGKYEESFGRIESCGESVNGTVTHNVTDLDPWTAYNVSIKNCRDTFCGKPAFAVSNTAVAAPSEVQNFSYVISKYVNVHFSWKVPEHANGPLDGYMLRIFDEDAQEVKLISLPGKDNNTRTDLKFQFHLFNVSLTPFNYDNTTNATLYGPESELKFETLGEGPMPPRPKTEDVNETSVLLSWEEPEDPRYNITAFQVQVTGQTPFTTTAHNVTIDHLNPWTNYEVNVSSCTNKTDCGQERHFHFKTDFGAPSAPRDFKAPSAGTHWMLIQWEKPEVLNGPLSGYNLTFSHGGSQSHAITTELSYNATDLVPGTNYEVAVFAFNEVESVIKNGPAVTLQASTQADTPSQAGASTATIVLAVLIPLIFLLLIAAFFLYKRYQNKTGERTPLTSAVDS